MKTILLVLFFSATFCYSQQECHKQCSELSHIEYVLFPEVEAKFPGGMQELKKYLSNNFVYPTCNLSCVKGKIYLQFIILSNGEVSEVEIIKGIGKEFDDSAIKTIKLMPKWIPAKCNAKNVNARVLIPINIL